MLAHCLFDKKSTEEINQLINDACYQAIGLLHFSYAEDEKEEERERGDKERLLSLWRGIYEGSISLKHVLSKERGYSDLIIKRIFKLEFIRSLLFDMFVCTQKTEQYYLKKCMNPMEKGQKPVKKISIGIHGMQTDYIHHEITKRLKNYLESIEESHLLDQLPHFIVELLCLPEDLKPATIIETQLFYADTVYDNFEKIIEEMNHTNEKLGIYYTEIPHINLYSWVGGDQDGIPITTRAHTEHILMAFQKRIKENYARDIQKLIEKYHDPKLEQLLATLASATQPAEALQQLSECSHQEDFDMYIFRLKLQSFGFHYMELEFRENSRIIHESLNQIIPLDKIQEALTLNKNYLELNDQQRESLLLYFLSKEGMPEKIVTQFMEKNRLYFSSKTDEHQGKTIYDLHETDQSYLLEYNAKRFLEWFYLIDKNEEAIHKFGIAEMKSITDALAVLFCIKAILKEKSIHIVMQPEGPSGAKTLSQEIERLYRNDLYMDFLKKNKDTQYITFGPSDIGKQGGRGMHIANMQLANIHRLIAKKYGIKLVKNIVIGHEHARCNNTLLENLTEYGSNKTDEIRYMLGGLHEMRHFLLTTMMVRNFFKAIYDYQFIDIDLRKDELKTYQDKFNFWIQSVNAYESLFFKHEDIRSFLQEIARLDIIRQVTQDSRPQSRKYWLARAEEDPSQIRAVAWTRSLLLSGFHFEWIGSHVWADYLIEELSDLFNRNKTFNTYVKSTAYACARTNLGVAWQLLRGEASSLPSLSELEYLAQQKREADSTDTNSHAQSMLARLHLYFLKSLQFVFKTVYKRVFSTPELFSIDRLSTLIFWPDLCREVVLREKQVESYYEIIVHRRQQYGEILPYFYAAFLNESNMAASYYMNDQDKRFLSYPSLSSVSSLTFSEVLV